jgi:hypothetical protein
MGLLWIVLGLSLVATLKSMPGVQLGEQLGWAELPEALLLAICCVALATVAGFLSMIPGGLAVRELVLITLLAPEYGEVAALVSAVLLRLIWLLSEVAVSTILYLAPIRKANPNSQPPTPNL